MVKAMHVIKGQGHIVGTAIYWFTSFSFHINPRPAIPEIQLFKNLPLKNKVKIIAKVKPDGHIWDQTVDYARFLFHGNYTIFG